MALAAESKAYRAQEASISSNGNVKAMELQAATGILAEVFGIESSASPRAMSESACSLAASRMSRWLRFL